MDFSEEMASYKLFDTGTVPFQVIETFSEGPPSVFQQRTLLDVCGSLMVEEGVDTAVFDRSANTDSALRYVTYFVFDRLC